MLLSVRIAVVALGGMLAVAALACSSTSTEPDIGNIRAGIPAGWAQVGGVSPSYIVGTDANTVHGGGSSLAIGGMDTSRLRFAGVGQFIRADDYLGKRVRFRAWVRQSNIVGNGGGLWMRVDGPGLMLAFDNFSSRPLLGSSNWHQVEIILDVASNAIGIAFGALLAGRGELFFDDVTFEIIPPTGLTTNQLFEPTAGTDSATVATTYSRTARSPINLDFEAK